MSKLAKYSKKYKTHQKRTCMHDLNVLNVDVLKWLGQFTFMMENLHALKYVNKLRKYPKNTQLEDTV